MADARVQAMLNPRADYNPIIDRKPLKLPGGARVAVWVVVNVELWDFNAPAARSIAPAPQGQVVVPDVSNFSWYEYGLRVGFWRIKELLDKHSVRAVLSLNAAMCESHARMVEECVKSKWEMLGHSYIQRVMRLEEDERATIRKTIQVIRKATGQTIRGWMSPGLGETKDTPDIVAEEGIEYLADWPNDDQPYFLKVKKGKLVSIPYSMEVNDTVIYIIQTQTGPDYLQRACDQFDTLYREGAKSARVMVIALHPNVSGVPYRAKYLDEALTYIKRHSGVLFMTGSEILDWYLKASKSS